MGLILGVITLASDSILPAMLLHVAINFSHQYVRPYAVEYLRQAGKSRLLPYLMLGLFLLLFVFLFSGLESIYQGKAYNEILQSRKELLRKEVEKARILREEDGGEKAQKRFLLSLKEIFLSPAFLAGIAIFVALVFQVFKGV